VAEIDEIECLALESDAQLLDRLVRDLTQKAVEYSKLMHQVGGRWMDGVAAEVTEKVAVLLHEDCLHT
jgi:hypothetical protein